MLVSSLTSFGSAGGGHCKDTQKCWPFCIGAPKGPFLQGLKVTYSLQSKLLGEKVQELRFLAVHEGR